MTAVSSDLLPPQCPSGWARTAVPPQCSALGSGSGGAAEPVSSAEGDSVGCCHRAVDGAVPVPAVPEQAVQQDAGFLNQSSALLLAQM